MFCSWSVSCNKSLPVGELAVIISVVSLRIGMYAGERTEFVGLLGSICVLGLRLVLSSGTETTSEFTVWWFAVVWMIDWFWAVVVLVAVPVSVLAFVGGLVSNVSKLAVVTAVICWVCSVFALKLKKLLF